jgi:hypothetical protein
MNKITRLENSQKSNRPRIRENNSRIIPKGDYKANDFASCPGKPQIPIIVARLFYIYNDGGVFLPTLSGAPLG